MASDSVAAGAARSPSVSMTERSSSTLILSGFQLSSPADDQVAVPRIVAVVQEVARPVLELDTHALPAVAGDAALGLAAREAGAEKLDRVAELLRARPQSRNIEEC